MTTRSIRFGASGKALLLSIVVNRIMQRSIKQIFTFGLISASYKRFYNMLKTMRIITILTSIGFEHFLNALFTL